MTLEDIFDHLTFGELSQINIGGAAENGITVDNRRDIVSHINMGLLELHKRFLLREGRLDVALTEGKHTFKLDPNEAAIAGFDQLKGDILRIERIYDQAGHELPLNQEGDPLSIHTPTMNTLWVPEFNELPHGWEKPTSLTVVFRESHPRIDKGVGAFTPETIEVDLPYTHLEPLLMYVASRVFNPIGAGGPQGTFHEGNNYAQKFEQACQKLEDHNYRVVQRAEDSRFRRRGWV